MTDKTQMIYINLDDSGKLVDTEKVSIYAGVVFTSKQEKDKFITQYRSIIKNLKCKYCKKDSSKCNDNSKCPELKHNMLKPKHNRQLVNYIKNYSVICCVINNDRVYPSIKSNKASKGRFLDYAIKLLVKQTVKGLIREKRINPDLPLKIVVNIDEQTTKTNGYYNLKDGILEELKYGIINYNYGCILKPVVNSDLEVSVCYQKSEKSYLIQASDLIAGTVRNLYLRNMSNSMEFSKRIEFIDYKIFLP